MDSIGNAVHLQIDFDAVFVLRKPLNQGKVLGKSNAIGVEHDVIDRLIERVSNNLFT